jgi:hypothetical protein
MKSRLQTFSLFCPVDSKEQRSNVEAFRVATFVNTCIVHIFDVHKKVQQGFIDQSHLDTRVHFLKLDVMKTPLIKRTWGYWKLLFEPAFKN